MYLEAAIQEELSDPKYAGRTHGTISCYNAGCHGLLCKAQNRLRARERNNIDVPMEPLDMYLLDQITLHKAERTRLALEEQSA